MDQAGDSGGIQAVTETGESEEPLGDDIMAAPSPPVFGNANANRTGSETNFRGINLDDIFSGVLFTPDGELLDIPSDDDENLNITLSTTSISEGRAQTPFAQFAVVGDTFASEESGSSGQFQDVLISPEPVKIEEAVDSESGPPSAGALPEPGHFQVPSNVGVGAVLGGSFTAEGATGVGTAQSNSKEPSVDRCSDVEGADASAAAAVAADAAAAAAVAAAEARAAQDAAVAKAEVAAKAAEAHAQAQARMQAGGTGTSENPPQFRSPGPVASNSFAALPTGGIIGHLSAHGMRTSLSQGIGIGSGGPGGVGIRGITSVAPPSGYRGRGSYAGSLPRRQRHKVSSKDLTEEQRNERRERNREHAKRSRVRKKFLLDSLQRSVDALQAENESLKGSIIGSLGQHGRELVAKCSPEDAESTLVTANPTQATKILDDPDYSLVKALQTAQQNFVITDASLPDNPIVFASNGFLELTRYKLNEVLGRNCRFLQGPETDPRAVDKIRTAIDEGYDTSVCLLNYRADDTTFWNQFFVAALRDGEGNTVNYVGVQCKVGDDYARIVVNAQKKQLARSGSAAGSTRRGPQTQREQPVLRPSTSGTAAILTVDAFSGASAAFAAESRQGQGQGQGGADI